MTPRHVYVCVYACAHMFLKISDLESECDTQDLFLSLLFVYLSVCLRVLCLSVCVYLWSKRNESECLDMCTCNRQ